MGSEFQVRALPNRSSDSSGLMNLRVSFLGLTAALLRGLVRAGVGRRDVRRSTPEPYPLPVAQFFYGCMSGDTQRRREEPPVSQRRIPS